MGQKILRRQGDLLFKLVDSIPPTAEKMEGNIVALGEATGHKHKATGGLVQLYRQDKKYDMYDPELVNLAERDPTQVDFMEVKQDTVMKHEEHNDIELPKGKYAVVHEREYDPFALEGDRIRQVLD